MWENRGSRRRYNFVSSPSPPPTLVRKEGNSRGASFSSSIPKPFSKPSSTNTRDKKELCHFYWLRWCCDLFAEKEKKRYSEFLRDTLFYSVGGGCKKQLFRFVLERHQLCTRGHSGQLTPPPPPPTPQNTTAAAAL